MNPKTMEEAVQVTLAEMRAMSPEELHAEIVKHRSSDLAELFRIAREFDDNFMRFPPHGELTKGGKLTEESTGD